MLQRESPSSHASQSGAGSGPLTAALVSRRQCFWPTSYFNGRLNTTRSLACSTQRFFTLQEVFLSEDTARCGEPLFETDHSQGGVFKHGLHQPQLESLPQKKKKALQKRKRKIHRANNSHPPVPICPAKRSAPKALRQR